MPRAIGIRKGGSQQGALLPAVGPATFPIKTAAAVGPANVASWNGLALTFVSTINGLSLANIATINGIA